MTTLVSPASPSSSTPGDAPVVDAAADRAPIDPAWLLLRLWRRFGAVKLSGPSLGLPESVDRAGYATLVRVEEGGQVRISDLAAQSGLDLSTVSRQVKALDAAGLVERAPDPDDRRACLVHVTAAGEQVLERVRDLLGSWLDAGIAGWSAEDRATLVRLLGRLEADLRPVRQHPAREG